VTVQWLKWDGSVNDPPVLLVHHEAQFGWKIEERRALFFVLGLLIVRRHGEFGVFVTVAGLRSE
jgi:hypothetical protein